MDCGACGKALTSTNPRARYCDSSCRALATKRRGKKVPELAALPAPSVRSGVYAATLAELMAAGREDTSSGQSALALASRVDAGADTGSALAAAVRQLGATLAEATAGAEKAVTPLDEVRARRDRKLGLA